MIDIIDNVEKLNSLKNDWERLEKNSKMHIFQTYAWCRTAWECCVSKEMGSKLWVLKWHQDGRDDVVIFPFYIDAKGSLRFIMDRHSDVCNAVYDNIAVNRYWCFREVADFIIAEPHIKNICLQKMRCGSEVLDYFGALFGGSLVYRDNAYAYMDLKPGGDISFSQSHMRSSDRKHWRHLLKKGGQYEFKVLSSVAGDEFPKDAINNLVSKMVKRGIRNPDFFPDGVMDLIKTLYDIGRCEIPVFMEDGEISTIEFRLIKDNYILDWIFLSVNPNAGTEINVKYCTECAKKRSGVLDFGVGAYEYKILTTRPQLGINLSLRFGKSKWRQFNNFISMNFRFFKDYVKSIIRQH